MARISEYSIDDKLTTPSDHKVIVCDLADVKRETDSMGSSLEITGWEVGAMSENSRKECAKA